MTKKETLLRWYNSCHLFIKFYATHWVQKVNHKWSSVVFQFTPLKLIIYCCVICWQASTAKVGCKSTSHIFFFECPPCPTAGGLQFPHQFLWGRWQRLILVPGPTMGPRGAADLRDWGARFSYPDPPGDTKSSSLSTDFICAFALLSWRQISKQLIWFHFLIISHFLNPILAPGP